MKTKFVQFFFPFYVLGLTIFSVYSLTDFFPQLFQESNGARNLFGAILFIVAIAATSILWTLSRRADCQQYLYDNAIGIKATNHKVREGDSLYVKGMLYAVSEWHVFIRIWLQEKHCSAICPTYESEGYVFAFYLKEIASNLLHSLTEENDPDHEAFRDRGCILSWDGKTLRLVELLPKIVTHSDPDLMESLQENHTRRFDESQAAKASKS